MSLSLGAAVDVFHAFLMAAWLLGLPLLFWHRWPLLTRAYAAYAVVFVLVSRLSHAVLGECFLTTFARRLWMNSDSPSETDEWFTVRLARLVFGLTPSHRVIALGSEALILITAFGVLLAFRPRPKAGVISMP